VFKRKLSLAILSSVLILANLFWTNSSATYAAPVYLNAITPAAPSDLIMGPNGYLIPDYFGVANWAFSPAPTIDPITGNVTGGIRKFVDKLPLLGPENKNNLGQYLSVAIPDKTTYQGGGTGYTSAPLVYIDAPPPGGQQATANATIADGVVNSIEVISGGSGYTSIPGVTFSGGGGMGTIARAVLSGDTVTAINLVPADYYEIALVEYEEKMHSDLPPTRLRGYVQLATPVVPGRQVPLFSPDGTTPILMPDGSQAIGVDRPHYLGPTIFVNRNTPVRVKFFNLLPIGASGDLFLPVDETMMGAGEGPMMGMGENMIMGEKYTQNRAAVHLHGNDSVWISDGSPNQWITPANEDTSYPRGVSVYNVPDMPDPGPGAMTFFYTNTQSARLLWYHDHSLGITRLNVYAGEAAGYIIEDEVEKDLINGTNFTGVNPGFAKVIPDIEIPLTIQDRTFVDATPAVDPKDGTIKPSVLITDPTWAWGSNNVTDPVTGYPLPKTGDLWYPHVYMPVQNPWDTSGTNPFGRWMYGPWFYPATEDIKFGPIPNEYYDPVNAPWEPPMRPDMPNPSMPGEAFMDTPLTAPPTLIWKLNRELTVSGF